MVVGQALHAHRQVRRHPLPHDLARRVDLEHPPAVARGDGDVLARKLLRGPRHRREEVRRAVLPADGAGHRVDGLHQRLPVGVSVVAPVVEEQDQPLAEIALADHARLVLVVEPVRVLPHDLAGLAVDDEHGVEVARADQNVARAEARIAAVEPAIGRQLVDRVEVGRVPALAFPAVEDRRVVDRAPLPDHAPAPVDLLQVVRAGRFLPCLHQEVAVAQRDQVVVGEVPLRREPVVPAQPALPVVLLDQVVGADHRQAAAVIEPRAADGAHLGPDVDDAPVHVDDHRHPAPEEDQRVAAGRGLRAVLAHPARRIVEGQLEVPVVDLGRGLHRGELEGAPLRRAQLQHEQHRHRGGQQRGQRPDRPPVHRASPHRRPAHSSSEAVR